MELTTPQSQPEPITLWLSCLFIASSRFAYQLTFHWLSQDWARCSPTQLLEQWVECLEQIYGELLSLETTQKIIGEWINMTMKEYSHGVCWV